MSEISGLPAADTCPSKAIPPLPTLNTLRAWLPLYLTKTDQTLYKISNILASPSQTDALLLTLGYSSLLASSLLANISLSRIRLQALSLIEKAISLPPGKTLSISPSEISPSLLLIVSQRLKAFSTLISDFRIFARLWGLVSLYTWGKSTWTHGGGDSIARGIVAAQVLINIAFQYLENGAYLASKGIVGWSEKKQGRAWLWSSRFWAAHVGLEFVRLGRERVVRGKEWKEREEEGWWRELVVNAAYAPLTLHWSLEKGLVSEFWVGIFGSVAGIAKMREIWRQSGEN
ncbi:hypothetical protein BUE80_DR010682 [Diplocarpon rosae]|nr:hypothetical protein BUE80_DR010682 [Diplocarpon rosae]